MWKFASSLYPSVLSVSLVLLADFAVAQPPSFDCKKVLGPIEKAICADASLSESDRKLSQTYHDILGEIGGLGLAEIRRGQREWLSYLKVACADADSRKNCILSEYSDRQKHLSTAVLRLGALIIFRADQYHVNKSSDPDDTTGAHPGLAVTTLSYPQIDNATNDSLIAFNKVSRGFAESEIHPDDSAADEDYYLDYQDVTVTDGMISVDFTSGSYGHGAAHGEYNSFEFHWLRREGRELLASDLFKNVNATKQLMALECFTQVKKYGFVKSSAELEYVASSPRKWSFGSNGLSVMFNPYEVASYADGEPTATIAWSKLKPYLRESAFSLLKLDRAK